MISDLKPYARMKDSGVPWLGQVPTHWQTERAKWLFRQMNRPVRDTDAVVTCFRDGTVTLRTNRRVRGFTEALKEIGYQGIRRGDLVIHAMDAFAGAIGVADSDGKGTPVYSVCEPGSAANAHYYAYTVREMARSQWLQALAKGIRERSTDFRFDDFGSQPVPLPPLPEQVAIVTFLDHADRRIRRYIRTKQKLIVLLEEQKQAIIHRAMTRGLDPTVRLKPSGVPWLGNVPEHWVVKRLHQITNPDRPVMYGIVLPGPNVDEGVYIVKGGNCEPGRLRPELLSRTTFEIESRYVRSRLAAGDVVFAIRGGVGAAELVPPDLAGANLTQDAARIAAGEGVDPHWLLHAVRAPVFREHVKSQVVGATISGINIRSLKRIEIVVPPHSEQLEIAKHIASAIADILATLDHARQEIALLREYRTRLIADVVTGKLDVREAAARLQDEDEEGSDAEVIEENEALAPEEDAEPMEVADGAEG